MNYKNKYEQLKNNIFNHFLLITKICKFSDSVLTKLSENKYLRLYKVKKITFLQPIIFTILFLLIFSAVVYKVDKDLSEEKINSKLNHLLNNVDNYIKENLENKLNVLISDSLVQYFIVDTTKTINLLGINSNDSTMLKKNYMAGYMKVRYSDAALDSGFVDKTKMYFGKNSKVPYEQQISKTSNGINVLPSRLVTHHKNNSFIEKKIIEFMNDNIEYFHQFNKISGGDKKIFYFEINDFGTGIPYIPIVKPFTRRVVHDISNEVMVYITFIIYVLYPLDDLIDGLFKLNIDVSIKNKSNDKYIYGDSVIENKLLNSKYGKQILSHLNRGNDFIITFAPNKHFSREWTFFPVVYILLFIISILFYFTLSFFIKKLRRKELVLKQANKALQTSNYTKDKFFSIISHDLRNPIMGLLNISYVFNDYYKNMSVEKIERTIDLLIKSITHIARMLENLLEWSRTSTGNIKLNILQNNIDMIVKLTLEDVASQAQSKNINLIFENTTTSEVYCDANMINTILRNLISNAIKFSKTHSKITIITDDYLKDNKYIVVTIKDEGIGMDTDTLNKLFRLDTKISTKGTMGEGGTGLGLILCKEFIDKHNCQIWVESEIDKGTEFKFTLLKFQ